MDVATRTRLTRASFNLPTLRVVPRPSGQVHRAAPSRPAARRHDHRSGSVQGAERPGRAHLRRTAHRTRRAAVRRRRHRLCLPGLRDALAAQFQHGRRRHPGGRADPRRSDRRWRAAKIGIGAGPSHRLSSNRSAAGSRRCDAVARSCGSRTAAYGVPARRIRTGPRVGIDYAGAYWAARRWRFWIESPAAICRTAPATG